MSKISTAFTDQTELRFAFGKNWREYLSTLNEFKLDNAVSSLKSFLGVTDLNGKSFIDVGSGSGLFSLSARKLGAKVFSFDYDSNSVFCTSELRKKYFSNDPDWNVEQGSVLSKEYLAKLGKFDVVYSWGVLHHTGNMWQALENVTTLVRPDGLLFISIYNDQGAASVRWTKIKALYNSLPAFLRPLVLIPAFLRLWLPTILKDTIKTFNPLKTWSDYSAERGMSPWHDVVDWVGGYPFEVAKPEEIFEFYTKKEFTLLKMKTNAGGIACNEFLFRAP